MSEHRKPISAGPATQRLHVGELLHLDGFPVPLRVGEDIYPGDALAVRPSDGVIVRWRP